MFSLGEELEDEKEEEGEVFKKACTQSFFYNFFNVFYQRLKKFSVYIGEFRFHLMYFFLLPSELTSVMMMNPNWSSQY